MAPISGLVNDNMLSPRAEKYEVDTGKEVVLTKLLLGLIVVAFGVFMGCTIWVKLKPRYEAEWKPKLKPKLQDCREKYEGWKEKMGAWHGPNEPKAPAPAHVARHISQTPDIDRITCDLTPKYLRKSTAIV
ncbi:uncharacterized protein N7518_004580 [Penicillium psychrosexuale]|uniref:uncharacterized protein n=1 Tax=Penicillium psychrosexuale TaxID=1002107 RepID=UPI002545A367|nr:uncharacterized protein N7518_004580 [Penicillium psychrosexuale]KAJ5796040.1 hypothetical protein N7518_004580 [Penicillium psychrosexuale]